MSSAALGRRVWLRPAGMGASAGGPALPPGGSVLSDSGDLSALPTPLFCPPLSSANGGCGWSGREGVPPPSQGSLNSLHPSSLHPVPPLHPTCRSWAGLCSVVGPLPCLPAVRVRGEGGAGGRRGRLCTSPGRLQHRLCLPAGGHSLSSLHQCALWTGNSPGSEEWLPPHPSPVGRKGHKAGVGVVVGGGQAGSAGGQVQAWPSTLRHSACPPGPPSRCVLRQDRAIPSPSPPPQFPNQRHRAPFLCWVPCWQDSQIPDLSALLPYFFTVQGQFSASIGDSPLWG
uniref:Uncharacterized protein n=1 Tax=Myotis myotis TaxID=51298 RepID=A0A7J7Z5R3_MYOMY|nr:hypothetical protein mMyoMyo1_010766 [Myotis myotis]